MQQASDYLTLPSFPALERLHERHPGLTAEVAANYAQAASVCLDQHQGPPIAIAVESYDGAQQRYRLEWTRPDQRTKLAWRNVPDAARDGGYSLVLGAAEVHLGLFALARAEARSGADYYVGQPESHVDEQGNLNLEEAIRLEVSGINRARYPSELWQRLREKILQVQAGNEAAGIAGVAVFSPCCVVFGNTSGKV